MTLQECKRQQRTEMTATIAGPFGTYTVQHEILHDADGPRPLGDLIDANGDRKDYELQWTVRRTDNLAPGMRPTIIDEIASSYMNAIITAATLAAITMEEREVSRV